MRDDDPDKPERGMAQYWLDMIGEAEAKLHDWQTASDNIDRAYASLAELRNYGRDREFQLFWSNIQIMGPSVYARPPVPVVTPKFKDRRPLYRTASEFIERCCIISFDMADIDRHMVAIRDDLVIVARGAAWVRYESDDAGERVCYEHVDRKDFLHDPARKWGEVDWVARRSWLTRKEMKKRFGKAADEVQYESRRDDGKLSKVEKCGVWEIWCKSENKVVWVCDGSDEVLEEAKPHLKLADFFPCPEPAYATVERRRLVPVPDMLMYKDQLDEVNALTKRIHALSDAIKVRGFYAGGGDIGEAVERAINLVDDTQVLVPVPAMASLMQGGGEPIVWLPLEMVARTITGLIELRRQVIDDVYQIIGLSDIMRGSTEASETLGAQRIKQQNGSYRVRGKQNELVRLARDLVRIGAEIMCEEFSKETLVDMSQMDLPTAADQKKKLKDYEARAKEELEALGEQAQQMVMQAQQSGQEVDPSQAEQQFAQQQQAIIQKWSQLIEKCREEVTIDAVMEFIGDQKMRPFALDIETDSTIYPDEMAEKESRQEFMGAFSQTMATLMPMFQLGPEAVAVAGGIAKFALAPYRVGRELEGLIDDFADQGPAMAQRMQESGSENDEMAQANMRLAEAEMKKAEAAIAKVQADTQGKQQEMELKAQEAQAKSAEAQQKFALEVEQTKGSIAETAARIEKVYAEIQKMGADTEIATAKERRETVKTADDMRAREVDRAVNQRNRDADRAMSPPPGNMKK